MGNKKNPSISDKVYVEVKEGEIERVFIAKRSTNPISFLAKAATANLAEERKQAIKDLNADFAARAAGIRKGVKVRELSTAEVLSLGSSVERISLLADEPAAEDVVDEAEAQQDADEGAGEAEEQAAEEAVIEGF